MAVECKSVSKSFKNRKIFDNLNVIFSPGICNCIVGKNGSGKTTLLKILAGLEKADTGEILVDGNCTYTGSNPYMIRGTVFENIKYPLTLKRHGSKVDENQVIKIIENLGLKELKNQDASVLSAGEKQKVVLGRAMIWKPDILLLDEPTTNIDKRMIECIEEILLEYAKDPSHTLILVSHDPEQVRRLLGITWYLEEQQLIKG